MSIDLISFQKKCDIFLDSLYGKYITPHDNFGQISRIEAEFLMNRVWEKDPKNILEIGVASGASSAALLMALSLMESSGKVVAFDCLEKCYFDEEKDVGFMVPTIFGGYPNSYTLHTGISSLNLGNILKDQKIDLLFIDGNHSHPWACIDTICCLPFLSAGAKVIYHDINLHHFGGPKKKLSTGPHSIFYNINARDKIVVGCTPYPNIGALVFEGEPIKILLEVFKIMFMFQWKTDAWPALDKNIILQLSKHIDTYFGVNAKVTFWELIKATGLINFYE